MAHITVGHKLFQLQYLVIRVLQIFDFYYPLATAYYFSMFRTVHKEEALSRVTIGKEFQRMAKSNKS